MSPVTMTQAMSGWRAAMSPSIRSRVQGGRSQVYSPHFRAPGDEEASYELFYILIDCPTPVKAKLKICWDESLLMTMMVMTMMMNRRRWRRFVIDAEDREHV